MVPSSAIVPDWVEPEHGGEVDELAEDAGGDAKPRVVIPEVIGEFQDGEGHVEHEEHADLVEGLPFL